MSGNSEIAVDIKNLCKSYAPSRKLSAIGEKEALKNVSLSIPQGSIYGLLGPNGAGKSTLINILAGLTTKTRGKVTINNIDLDEEPIKTRYSIGVVPQEIVLDPFFSIYETLEYHAGYFGVPKENRRTMELLEALSLTDKANTSSRRLSGGMKRRVLIAKALVHNPPILILDEPTAGVDVELREQLWNYVRELNKNGATILLTTHYLEEAENLCDYIAIINNGEIIANDTTSNLMKILDRKQLTIRFLEELSAVPRGMEKFNAKLENNYTVSLDYNKSDESMLELTKLIRRAELNIVDISSKEPDLEDIFKHLVSTGKSGEN